MHLYSFSPLKAAVKRHNILLRWTFRIAMTLFADPQGQKPNIDNP
jgi:hypothetical protein